MKHLGKLDDKAKQRAEVAVYFKRFDEAEQLYMRMDRPDLAIDMRMRLGDWFKVGACVGLRTGPELSPDEVHVCIKSWQGWQSWQGLILAFPLFMPIPACWSQVYR